jgi:hypothetical protein
MMCYLLIQWYSLHRRTLSIDRCTRSFISIYLCVYSCLIIYFVFYFRPNSNESSPPSEITESLSSTNQQTKNGIPLNRQSSDELSSQQAKRKFSLSQYKEHKRLKSNEVQNSLADTDMRINNMGNSKVRISLHTYIRISNEPSIENLRRRWVHRERTYFCCSQRQTRSLTIYIYLCFRLRHRWLLTMIHLISPIINQ